MPEVDTDALRADANDAWQTRSLDLAGLKDGVDGLRIVHADFSLVPGSNDVALAYETARQRIHTYLATGEEVLEGIARALLDTSIDYLEAEGDAQSEIDAVEREMEEL